MKRKILIDTDPGCDDALALMLACASPEFDIVAVTTVCGNSTIQNTTRNARFILDFLCRSDIPVYSGADKPLARELIQAVVHGTGGLGGVEPVADSMLTGDAVVQILQCIRANPNELTVVALGPLTNIAKAIQTDPETMSLVKEIVVMGGAIHVAGNQNRVAEFNMFVDPEAADVVMQFAAVKTLVPLDACNDVCLPLGDVAKLTNERLGDLLVQILMPYMANLEKDMGVRAAVMYDPLTIFYLLQPDLCRTMQANVQIETKGDLTRGMTVVDKRPVPDNLAPNATLVMEVPQQAFIDLFVDRLDSLETSLLSHRERQIAAQLLAELGHDG